jgi:hypothetical protein
MIGRQLSGYPHVNLALGLGQLFPDHFAEDLWYKARRELVLETVKPSACGQNRAQAHRSAAGSRSRAESVGLERAKIVDRLLKELNALRPQMQVPEDDFPKLRRENPSYLVFKICEKHPSAARWVKLLPERRTIHRLAFELAGAKCGLTAATIQTAWKRFKSSLKK